MEDNLRGVRLVLLLLLLLLLLLREMAGGKGLRVRRHCLL